MNILLTNDDSIYSPGIKVLARHLAANHKITVAAPKEEMSGISHSFTIFSPLFFEIVEFVPGVKAYAIQGTPSDCVKIGVTKLSKPLPDMVISGFNNGDNSGISAFYSGTVAGAREGAFFGIKSLSLSLCSFDDAHFNYALKWLDGLLLAVSNKALEFGGDKTYLNINFPACNVKKIKGTRITRQGTTPFRDKYEERVNPAGQKYYWLFGDKPASSCRHDDECGLEDNFVTVTPLTIDQTDHAFFEKYSSRKKIF
jgi:5'-nucleotidase